MAIASFRGSVPPVRERELAEGRKPVHELHEPVHEEERRSTRDTRSVLRKTRDLNEGTLRWFCATDGALPTEARCRLHHVLGVEIDVGRGNGDGSLSSSSWPAYLPLMDALKLLLF